MGYTALYRKFRPQTFAEMVGQEHITRTLRNQIMANRVGHAYLFNGGRGTGKTTSAKVLARAINCLNPQDGEPCNECEICKAALNGSLTDIVEMDAASNNSVEDIRSIREEVNFLPTKAKYRVYIIDEVHMLSQGAFNALLKTLEEPPEHVKFILATTEPQKLPATILSRVQTFQLSKISLKGIHDRLKYVLDHEIAEGRNITYTDDAITYIAKLANGGMRDALTTLDKALSYSEDVKIENLEISLSLPNFNDYFTLLNAIVRKNNNAIIQTINDVYNSGVNFVKWFEGFHSFLCNIVKYIFLRDISLTMIPSTYEEKISVYGPSHSAFCLQLSNKLVKLIADLKRTQYLQEYAITYLCDSTKK